MLVDKIPSTVSCSSDAAILDDIIARISFVLTRDEQLCCQHAAMVLYGAATGV